MDNNKRGLEAYGIMDNTSKRSRADEFTTRLLITKQDMGKLIGKGGATITEIRGKSGANFKGVDVDELNRMVVISGQLRQVLDCFDLITDILYSSYVQSIPSEHFRVQLLIDHSRAGIVVGTKGTMIQALKSKSGCVQVKIMKDPVEISGHLLRILIIEGALPNIRRAHFNIQELFSSDLGATSWGSNSVAAPSFAAVGGHVPINGLVNFGIHADTVRQLRDIQSYITQFGLDLYVAPIGGQHSSLSNFDYGGSAAAGSYQSGLAGGSGRAAAAVEDTGPKMEFYIPKDAAGAIIGKGGSTLKELSAEFHVKIFVEKEDIQNMRKVVIRGESEAVMNLAKDRVAVLCQQQVAAASAALSATVPANYTDATSYQQSS